MLGSAAHTDEWGATAASERARLVALCAHLTGHVDAAEDLAQQTLFEAWRNEHKLRDPSARTQWLAGIARNLCLNWARRRGRELALIAPDLGAEKPRLPGLQEELPDELDLEIELERHELAQLLDRAMALLPPETRAVLVHHYIEGSPHAEIAERLQATEGAVRVRLHRGKLALRRVLLEDFGEEARSYGLLGADGDDYHETCIWCPGCGTRRLVGRFSPGSGELALRCPGCQPDPAFHLAETRLTAFPEVFGHLTRIKPAYLRLMEFSDRTTREALQTGTIGCASCGHINPLQRGMPAHFPPEWSETPGIHVTCARCGWTSWWALGGLVFQSRDVREFWRDHPRLYGLPARKIEAHGRPAVVWSMRSLTDSAGLDLVSSLDTFELLAVHRPPSE